MLVAAMSIVGCGSREVSPDDSAKAYSEMVSPAFPEAGDACLDRWTTFEQACARAADVCNLADDMRRCLVDAGTASLDVSELTEEGAVSALSARRADLNRRIDESLTLCTGQEAQFYEEYKRTGLLGGVSVIRVECRFSDPYQPSERYHFVSEGTSSEEGKAESDIAKTY
ncbi:hypothetical protein COW94_03435 [Candidatus Peregrinibacteria bacterium CG22_combo_CG10-13_8_21_14_all_44_10]|nr:MAG: hypothetical protein COW94_03435 [Candidatus Peregrinibacteria bacterium CG22_combo_CG10-13_8_21_14_all_44_10]PIX79365.1 MAG: hypothetical protein COZ35_03550 [Candidatus Peregrinibacteria bacterium CG_4_10_14_3_um_filter_44_21]